MIGGSARATPARPRRYRCDTIDAIMHQSKLLNDLATHPYHAPSTTTSRRKTGTPDASQQGGRRPCLIAALDEDCHGMCPRHMPVSKLSNAFCSKLDANVALLAAVDVRLPPANCGVLCMCSSRCRPLRVG